MKVLFLTRLYHPHIGGVERHVAGICRELKKKHEITVLTEQYEPSMPLEEIVDDIRVIRIPLWGVGERQKKWHIWKWINQHQNLLSQMNIIHTHDVVFWVYWYKFIHPHKKIFVTFHGWEGRYPVPLKFKLIRKFNELITSGNICVGDFISKWYGTRPDFVTYGAI